MATNTLSSAFRKIDVDQYNEDQYREDDPAEPQSPPSGPDESEVNNLLMKGNNIEALIVVLKNAPLASKNQQVKDNALNLTMKVLMSFKSSQMDEAVAALSSDLVDTLMKYIYRGFEFLSEKRSGQLLLWHEKVYAVGGLGSIVRVLTESKRA
ncbi:actin-related protein 2/3 complex subunit 5-like protein [Cimex lectularius]|uniref:Actin-related protein 2/3 complex subunit 5 n=1 Tax=Cimex lectularius TaxID=79782 RepID=A0A8I6RXB2_CIMLE|nr:actin-related protein 2/3 complex subunit 5-like protein [Cimex lectularius]